MEGESHEILTPCATGNGLLALLFRPAPGRHAKSGCQGVKGFLALVGIVPGLDELHGGCRSAL